MDLASPPTPSPRAKTRGEGGQRPGEGPHSPKVNAIAAEATPYVVLFALMLLISQSAFACSVCYGAPGDPLVKGANNGIMFLLGIVGFVQIGFIALFWSFWRRAREQKRFRESLKVIEGGARS
jgi:hypothetical protein